MSKETPGVDKRTLLVIRRGEVARLFPQVPPEIKASFRGTIENTRIGTLDILRQESADFIGYLNDKNELIKKVNGKSLSLPFLLSRLIDEILVSHLENLALVSLSNFLLKSKNPVDMWEFVARFDAHVGSQLIPSAITTGEYELLGEVDQKFIEARKEQKGSSESNSSFSDEVSLFLKIKARTKKAEDLLKKDPSGFLLVDECVRELTEDDLNSIPVLPYQDREFLLAGAIIARDVYKCSYSLVREFPNSIPGTA